MLGLNVDRVEAGTDYIQSSAGEQTLQQRLVLVARDVTQAKRQTTIDGYLPLLQKALAFWWQKQFAVHRQHGQGQQVQGQQRGEGEGQQQELGAGQGQAQQQQHQQQPLEPPPGQEQQDEEMEDEQMQPAASSLQCPVDNMLVSVNSFFAFIRSIEQQSGMRRAFPNVLGSSSNAGSSRGQQQLRLSADAIPEVQAARRQLLGAACECNPHHGQLSLGYWEKHMFALTWLQDKQYHLAVGKLSDGECVAQQHSAMQYAALMHVYGALPSTAFNAKGCGCCAQDCLKLDTDRYCFVTDVHSTSH